MRERRRFAIDVILIVAMLVCLATGMTLQAVMSMVVRDIDAPVRHAAWLALGNGAVLLIAGVALLLRTTQPFFHRLEASEATNRAVVATALDGIVTVDCQGLITAINRSACRIFGCTEAEAMWRPLTDFVPALHQARLASVWPLDGSGAAACMELIGLRRDGGEAPLEVTGSRQQLAQRNLWTGIFRDITARKDAERKLQESFAMLRRAKADADAKADALAAANAELDDFTYIVSHDLKEPLRGIRLLCQMIEEDSPEALDGEARQRIAATVRMCLRAEQQVADLFQYSRVGRRAEAAAPVDLGEVVADALESLAHRIDRAEAKIDVCGPLPKLPVDRTLATDVFCNLVANALKFNHSRPPRVEIGCDDGIVPTFYVRDNGIGIEPRHHEGIFDIFRRLHAREKYEGTGAGLTIVRKIIAAHGGQIWVESQPGQGSTFYFTWSPQLAPAQRVGEAAAPPAGHGIAPSSDASQLLEVS